MYARGATFDVQHSLDCMRGGYRTIQHNEVRDVLASVIKEAGFKAVETEPQLQPLSGESFDFKSANKEEDARSDIKCNGFWRPMRTAYFDIKVVSPLARSYVNMSVQLCTRWLRRAKSVNMASAYETSNMLTSTPLFSPLLAVWAHSATLLSRD